MNTRLHFLLAAMALALLAAGCSNGSDPAPASAMTLQVTSPAFADGQPIPKQYTGQGDDISPPLQWSGAPPQTKCFALLCQDPDAPSGTFTHWVVWNMSSTATSLSENVGKGQFLPDQSQQGKNSFGNVGYNGPNPPAGQLHHYYFKIYALDAFTLGQVTYSGPDLESAMKGHVLAWGQLMGTYQSQ